LTAPAIQKYPKLSLLVYEALQPYMLIFDNKYVAFTAQCVAKDITRDLGQPLEKSPHSTPKANNAI